MLLHWLYQVSLCVCWLSSVWTASLSITAHVLFSWSSGSSASVSTAVADWRRLSDSDLWGYRLLYRLDVQLVQRWWSSVRQQQRSWRLLHSQSCCSTAHRSLYVQSRERTTGLLHKLHTDTVDHWWVCVTAFIIVFICICGSLSLWHKLCKSIRNLKNLLLLPSRSQSLPALSNAHS